MANYKEMVKLKDLPYPEAKDISEEHMNKFFYGKGGMSAYYTIEKNKIIARNKLYFNVGYSVSWYVISYALVCLGLILGAIKVFIFIWNHWPK